MKRTIQRTAAIVLGLMLGVSARAGLETVTNISDLNASWPLGSDLASTSDDHIRNIKTALKNDFPNINGAVSATPTQLNQLTTNTFAGVSTFSGQIKINSFATGNVTNGFLVTNAANTRNTFQVSDVAVVNVGNTTDNGATNFLGSGAVTFNGQIVIKAFMTGNASNGVEFTNAANTINTFQVTDTGVVNGRGPTAAAFVDMTPDTGTFTATYTGFTTTVQCTATWTRIGKLAMLNLCASSGTSNTGTFTMTGLPAAMQPSSLTQHIALPSSALTNSGSIVGTSTVNASVASASGTVTFYINGAAGGWTASGGKGFNAAATISYLLN